jgi:hypothetical protein
MPGITKTLADGSIGYAARPRWLGGRWFPREDDCFASALATVLQVPIDELPDPRIDERLAAGESAGEIARSAKAEFGRWLVEHGLRMVKHRSLARASSLPRWLGICPNEGCFQDHCLVMAKDAMLFDPGSVTDMRMFGLAGAPLRAGVGLFGFGVAPLVRTHIFTPAEIRYGYSFPPTTTAKGAS